MNDITICASSSFKPTEPFDEDSTWRALTSCQISMPLSKIPYLLPQFKETVVSLTTWKDQPIVSIHLADSSTGPPVMDAQNPGVKLIIKGCDLHRCILDGGFRVNVISKATFYALGINQLEPCPFWLRMVYTCSVRLLGLIWQLNFVLRGHTFTISTVVLRLEALEAYPLLLRCPYLLTTNIK